ncbi:MAG: hypothetical protein ACYDCK_14750 [Thermoplasmatota archaeon]
MSNLISQYCYPRLGLVLSIILVAGAFAPLASANQCHPPCELDSALRDLACFEQECVPESGSIIPIHATAATGSDPSELAAWLPLP